MSASFLFYDLETSGFSPREARIMQFAGQRTDLQLNPIGEPYNYLIRVSEDILPDPDAVLVTGITPQQTLADGLHEAEFLKIFHEQIALPDTVFLGFNSIRFDDEFMRFLHYRNFYDPYEWQWQNGRGRWDLLDVVRMTRALRPDGIQWPFDSEGKPANRLEMLTSLNNLDHANAHDALSDVQATIAVARLIRGKQSRLFDFLLGLRTKQAVAELVGQGKPFVYTSGKYPSEFEKTTVVEVLSEHPAGQGVLVFDLRHDPELFVKLTPEELAEAMRWKPKEEDGIRLPVEMLKFNRCPALAPLTVLDEASHKRLKLDPEMYKSNHEKLLNIRNQLAEKVVEALKIMEKQRQTRLLEDESDVDARLYEGFFGDPDRTRMSMVRAASPDELNGINAGFDDGRLQALLPLYKARNFPKSLSGEEREIWERFCRRKLTGGGTESRLAKFFERLSQLDDRTDLAAEKRYLLEELQLYAQSIMPSDL